MKKSYFIIGFLTVCTTLMCLLFSSGCSDDEMLNSSYAKVYFFWHRPAFNNEGYEVFVLSNYSSSHFSDMLKYKITQNSVDHTNEVKAPSPVRIGDQMVYFNQCGSYDIQINVRGEVKKISNFRYKGEQSIMVARGYGWAMFISRDNWK